MSTAINAAAGRPIQTARMAIGLVALALFSGTAARTVLSPLQELVRVDLGMSDNQMAILQGFAMALPMTLISIPIGRLVDRASRTRLLFVLALLCAAGSAFTAFAQDFTTMLIARLVVGAAVVAALPAAVSLASDLSDANGRGRAVSLLAAGQVLGMSVTFVLVGTLLERLPASVQGVSGLSGLSGLAPWRLVQLSFALAMLLLSLLLLLLREPQRHEMGKSADGSLRAALSELWAYRRLLIPLVIGFTTISMADAAASIWAVPVLTRSFHQQPSDFGGWMSAAFLFSGLGGTVMGGLLADVSQRKFGRSGVLLGAALAALLSIPAALFPLMPGVASFATLFAILLATGACASVVGTAAVTVLIPNELRGLCLSAMGTVAVVVAYGIAPSIVSVAAQVTGHGEDIRIPLAMVGLVSGMVGLAAYAIAMREARAAKASTLA